MKAPEMIYIWSTPNGMLPSWHLAPHNSKIYGNHEYIRADIAQTQLAQAHSEASSLAMAMWRTDYQKVSPNFELSDSVAGIITQIDNMHSGALIRLEGAKEMLRQLRERLASAMEWEKVSAETLKHGDFVLIQTSYMKPCAAVYKNDFFTADGCRVYFDDVLSVAHIKPPPTNPGGA
jgi:hypothetical protein